LYTKKVKKKSFLPKAETVFSIFLKYLFAVLEAKKKVAQSVF